MAASWAASRRGHWRCSADVSFLWWNVTDGRAHIAMYVFAAADRSLVVDGVIVAAQTPLCTAARGAYEFFWIGAMTTSTASSMATSPKVQVYNRALNIRNSPL